MIIFPAIDIKNGKVVRLLQGEFDKITEYANDPAEMAKTWASKGAQWLHVVDLDGAQTGKITNLESIKAITSAINIPVEMGGGIQTREDVETLIDAGISRIILGTKVFEDLDFLKEVLSFAKDKIAVSLDCKDGMIAKRGWTETTNINAVDFAKQLEELGVQCLIYTDIATDGMLTGPNIPALEELLDAVNIPVIASGGVSNLDDIRKLAELTPRGLLGAITGKAIYEGTLNLEDALKLC